MLQGLFLVVLMNIAIPKGLPSNATESLCAEHRCAVSRRRLGEESLRRRLTDCFGFLEDFIDFLKDRVDFS